MIGALSLCIAVLAGAWWQSARTRDVVTAAAQASLALPAPEHVAAPRESPTADLALRDTPAGSAVHAAAYPDGFAGAVDPARTLPNVAEARSAGMALPTLDLQLLSYSENPAARFVFINGFQYRQGQRVQNGPLIVTIYSEGVVLRQEGRDFVLLPD